MGAWAALGEGLPQPLPLALGRAVMMKRGSARGRSRWGLTLSNVAPSTVGIDISDSDES